MRKKIFSTLIILLIFFIFGVIVFQKLPLTKRINYLDSNDYSTILVKSSKMEVLYETKNSEIIREFIEILKEARFEELGEAQIGHIYYINFKNWNSTLTLKLVEGFISYNSKSYRMDQDSYERLIKLIESVKYD